MFKVDEYKAIAPPLVPMLFRNEILPESVMLLEYAVIGVFTLLANVTSPVVVTLRDKNSTES